MGTKRKKSPTENRPPVGRRFQKGQSGNPGGRPKEVAEFRKRLLSMSPDVAGALEEYIRGPTDEQLSERKMMWFAAMAKERIAAIKVWCEFAIPKPKVDDEFDRAVPVNIDPEKITTLGLVSEVRLVLATEIKRLQAIAAMGTPLTESAAVRLTECVKQLAVVAEQEAKILASDEMADKSEAELRKFLTEADLAGAH